MIDPFSFSLESYTPPKGLNLPQRNLDIFRDETDFTGVEYNESVEQHLKSSAKLIVVCSPDARASKYVNDEIRLFVQSNDANNIIPVLLHGIPNNEANSDQGSDMAFPEALCDVLEMPLAVNYVGVKANKDKLNKGVFESAWYTILANLYDVSRSLIEQRERKRQLHRRRITGGIVGLIMLALSAALVVTLISRQTAIEQRQLSEARQLATQAELVATRTPQEVDLIELRALLGTESLRKSKKFEDRRAITEALQLLPARTLQLPYQKKLRFRYRRAFSGDGRRIAIAQSKKTMIFDTTSGEPVVTDITHLENVYALALNHDATLLAVSQWSSGAHVIDLASGTPIKAFHHEGRFVEAISFSMDSKYLAIAYRTVDKTLVEVREIAGGNIVWGNDYNKSRGLALTFSSDGKWLGTGSGKTAKIIELETGKEISNLEGELVSAIAFHPTGKLVATANYDGTVDLYKLPRGKKGFQIPLPKVTDLVSAMDRRGVPVIAYSRDGNRLGIAGGAGIIRVIDFTGAAPRQIGRWDFRGHISSLVFSKDAQELLAATHKNQLLAFVLDPSTAYLEAITLADNGTVSLIADGRYVAGGGFDWTAKVYETATGSEIFAESKVSIDSVVASGNGQYIAFVDRYDDNEIRVYDFMKRAPHDVLTVPGDVTKLAFSGDGAWLAASTEEEVLVFDVSNKKFVRSVQQHASINLALGAKGKYLAIADEEGLSIFDLMASGSKKIRVTEVKGVISGIFNADSRYLAVACADDTVKVIDVSTGNLLMEKFQRGALALAFSNDGKYVAAGGKDNTARVYVTETGEELARLHYQEIVRGISFTADQRQLVTSTGSDLQFRKWHSGDITDDACSRLTRNLSRSEWQQYFLDEPYAKTCSALPEGE